jgi:preprotein translocase subunit YajC
VSTVPVIAQQLIAQESNPLGLLILVLPIAAIIFLTIVPQRRQRQKQQELINSLAVGDDVVTIGGLHGTVNVIEDDIVHLEVDHDVVIRVGRGAIARKAGEPDPAAPASRSRARRPVGGAEAASGPDADAGDDAADGAGARDED